MDARLIQRLIEDGAIRLTPAVDHNPMTTLRIRIPQDVAQKLATWARREHTDQSTAARQLLECGWTFLLLERYRQGRLSVGKLARE
ncbi:MAG: hypothetical protein HYZ89_02100 [Candidatus Omnitrophica bacterium]|nr:hypothetical protein [Candidatus Omnitrophota bacterium]